jgi:hypothetical protein
VFQPDDRESAAGQQPSDLCQEAEQVGLDEALLKQPPGSGHFFHSLRYWLGTQMIRWGLRLQGYSKVYEREFF